MNDCYYPKQKVKTVYTSQRFHKTHAPLADTLVPISDLVSSDVIPSVKTIYLQIATLCNDILLTFHA